MTPPRPHDLLRIALAATAIPASAPGWVSDGLARAPWVVVRRAPAQQDHIPVGIRGVTRAQRYAMTVRHAAVEERVAPEQLTHVESSAHADMVALAALRTIRPHLVAAGLRWGPTGAVGYQLASGVPAVHPASDLDLVVRIDHATPPVLRILGRLQSIFDRAPARVDCQVETPRGAVALAEIISGATQILLRGASGPRLIDAGALTQ